MLWNDLEMEINICNKCNLERIRKNPIVGRGNKNAHIMFVLDDISEVEDRKEELLSDKNGEYLYDNIDDPFLDHAIIEAGIHLPPAY